MALKVLLLPLSVLFLLFRRHHLLPIITTTFFNRNHPHNHLHLPELQHTHAMLPVQQSGPATSPGMQQEQACSEQSLADPRRCLNYAPFYNVSPLSFEPLSCV